MRLGTLERVTNKGECAFNFRFRPWERAIWRS